MYGFLSRSIGKLVMRSSGAVPSYAAESDITEAAPAPVEPSVLAEFWRNGRLSVGAVDVPPGTEAAYGARSRSWNPPGGGAEPTGTGGGEVLTLLAPAVACGGGRCIASDMLDIRGGAPGGGGGRRAAAVRWRMSEL